MAGKMLMEREGPIGWMIFDHPERRNAVTQEMWLQMGEILQEFARDDAIRVVVLKGTGDKAFVSGADISQFAQKRKTRPTSPSRISLPMRHAVHWRPSTNRPSP
jgi:enoyl-CoA hydratase